jgi:sugar fermentation stimulation protein A
MQFECDLLAGRLIDRYKRFFADVRLEGGEVVVTHCPNPGSMKNCRPADARVWVRRNDNPRRTLRYTWELVEVEDTFVCVNTSRNNLVVAEALAAGAIAELRGYDRVRSEVRYGERSRVDFLLSRGDQHCYVEVKGVTLGVGQGVSAFPDSVTARGTRHLRELMAMVAAGHRAALLFCAARADTQQIRPADDIDPVYGETLRAAAAAGVEILGYRCDVSPAGIWLRSRVPVELAKPS